jgi:hypothetical protein
MNEGTISLEAAVLKCPSAELYLYLLFFLLNTSFEKGTDTPI